MLHKTKTMMLAKSRTIVGGSNVLLSLLPRNIGQSCRTHHTETSSSSQEFKLASTSIGSHFLSRHMYSFHLLQQE